MPHQDLVPSPLREETVAAERPSFDDVETRWAADDGRRFDAFDELAPTLRPLGSAAERRLAALVAVTP